jgi:hypothetical protein
MALAGPVGTMEGKRHKHYGMSGSFNPLRIPFLLVVGSTEAAASLEGG